jgi:radical SAM superfamily enzyme YgiQ (UPF0313 family)
MFDNTKFNVILMSDYTSPLFMQRGLGVSKVAAELRYNGFEVLVINHLHIFSQDELKKILRDSISDKTLFVGVNSVFYQSIANAQTLGDEKPWESGGLKYGPKEIGAVLPHSKTHNKEIKDVVRAKNPKCMLVLGGPDAQDKNYISTYDYVILGYADISAINLARHLAYGDKLEKSRKSIFGPIIIDDAKAENYKFTDTPMFWSDNDIVLPRETLPIEISRGCIFQCKFCSFPLNGKKKNDYVKDENILYAEMIDNYSKFGVTRYIFADDTFNDSPDKINMISRLSKRLPFELEYYAFIRLDLLTAHPENIELLFDSGLRAAYFGIETLNEKTGSAIGKGGNRERLIATIQRIKKQYGDSVTLNGSFIFGLPYEPVDDMKRTAQQLVSGETGLDSWSIYPLMLNLPGGSYPSQLEGSYDKFGYTVTKIDEELNLLVWQNEHTNFYECMELASKTLTDGGMTKSRKASGLEAFYAASLGFDLSYLMNKFIADFDWHSIELKKGERIIEYKNALYKQIYQ